MKTRKLLSALLAASVIFSTMTFTVSAARNDISIGSSAYDTLEEAIAAAQDGDTIDLNNSTVEPSGAINNIADKSITITNGVIDLSDVVASGTYLFKITGSGSVVTFSEISFEGDDYNSKNGIIYAGGGAEVVIDYCGFDLDTEKSTSGGVFKGESKDTATFTLTESNLELSKVASVISDATVKIDSSSITASGSTSSTAKQAAFNDVYGIISSGSYIKASGFYYGIKNNEDLAIIVDESTLLLSSNTYDIYFNNGGTIVSREDSKVTVKKWYKPEGDEKLSEFLVEGNVEIDGVEYGSLEDAVRYAENGDTIDLLESTVTLNGSTMVVNNISVTITNGTIDIDDSDYEGSPVFKVTGSNGILTFDDVEIEGSGYTTSALVRIEAGAEASFKSTDIKLGRNKYPSACTFLGTDHTSSKLTIRNCDISLTSPISVMAKLQLNMIKSNLTAKSSSGDAGNAFRDVYGKISNSEVSLSTFGNGIKNAEEDGLVLANNTEFKLTGCNKGINSVKGYDINCSEDSYIMVESGSDLDYGTIKDEDCIKAYQAELDGDEYMTLKEAVSDARTNDTIKIIGKAEADKETVDEIYEKELSIELGKFSIVCEYGAADISEWIEKSGTQKIKREQVKEDGDIVGYEYTLSGTSSSSSSSSSSNKYDDDDDYDDEDGYYTVKFNSKGGSTVSSKKVKEGRAVTKPSNPKKDGYVFAGWYTNSALTKKYDFDEEVYDSFTLYAKWVSDGDNDSNYDNDDYDNNYDDNYDDDYDDNYDDNYDDEYAGDGWFNPFYDVTTGDWFYDSVKYAYENNLMMGTSGETFEPSGYVTRGMFVTVLYRIENEPYASASYFEDVADGTAWYYNAVAWAYENAIVMGTSETEFSPDATITREQMAAMCYRYAEYKGKDTSVAEESNILSYDDFGSISEYAIPAMQYVCGSGIMQGTDSFLSPQGVTTRAEAATVFTRINKLF